MIKIPFSVENRVVIIFLILLQLLVSIPFINSYSIGLDEPFSIFHSQRDLGSLLTELNQGNNAPLHFVLLHFWIKIFGISAFSVRSLSLLFGVISTILMFKITSKVLTRNIAVVVSLFFIFSTFNHYYNLEARNYSLLVCLFLLIVFEQINILKGTNNTYTFVRLGIWNILLLYTHYLGVFILGVELLMFLLFIKKLDQKKIIALAILFALSILAYLPSLLVFLERINEFSTSGTWVVLPHWTELYGNIIRFLNGLIPTLLILSFLTLFLIINRAGFTMKMGALLKNSDFVYFFIFFILTYVGMFIFSFVVQPIFIDRYLIYISPLLFICIGFFAATVTNKDQRYLPYFFVLPMLFFCNYIPNSDRNANDLVNYIKANEKSKRAILICPPFYDLTFLYYYDQEIFKNLTNKDIYFKREKIYPIYNQSEINIDPNISTILFVDANSKDLYPENLIHEHLEEKYNLVEKETFKGGFNVYIYEGL